MSRGATGVREVGAGTTRTVARLARPSWRDPRLLVGVVLVLAGVVVGSRAVAAAERTTGVYAVAAAVGAGTAVSAQQVRVVQVRLEDTGPYLLATQPLPAGAVALRGMGAGELVPRSALGEGGDLARRPVSLPVEAAPPAGVVAGGLVDVWVSWPADPSGTPGSSGASERSGARTQLVAEGAEVSAVSGPGSGLAARTASEVQVLVAQDALPVLLQALALDARVDVVPVPGTAPGGAS